MTKDHPIFSQITEDSILSSDMRAKVLSLRNYSNDPVFGRFIQLMCGYILGGHDAPRRLLNGTPIKLNYPRYMFEYGLNSD